MNEHRELKCDDRAADDLLLLVAGLLDPERASRVDSHVTGCADCRERRQTLEWLRETMRTWGDALDTGHVPTGELVRYVDDPAAVAPGPAAEISRHLEVCGQCAEEVAVLESVDRSPAPGVSRPSAPSPWERIRHRLLAPAPGPAWAYAAVALVAVPTAVGVQLWRSREAPLLTVPPPQTLTGSATRGEGGVPTLALDAGVLSVSIEVPVLADPGVRYDLELRDRDGNRVWETGDARPVDRFGTFLVVIRSGSLDPGAYRLIAHERDRDTGSDRDAFEFEFILERAR